MEGEGGGRRGGESSTVRQKAQRGKTARVWRREGGCECVRRRDGQQDEEGVKIQLLSSSSVAVSTSQDFDDNATITSFWGEKNKTKAKPM